MRVSLLMLRIKMYSWHVVVSVVTDKYNGVTSMELTELKHSPPRLSNKMKVVTYVCSLSTS